jgi:hypothetical protein
VENVWQGIQEIGTQAPLLLICLFNSLDFVLTTGLTVYSETGSILAWIVILSLYGADTIAKVK